MRTVAAGATVLSIFLAGCGAVATTPIPIPDDGSLGYRAVVAPFPVFDSTDTLLELAFLGGLNHPRPQLVDLDGDGQLDLVIQEYNGRMLHLRRNGRTADGLPRFELVNWRLGGVDIGEWSRFADLDGDGRADLLAEQPFSYLKLFKNVGTAGRFAFQTVTDSLRDTSGGALFSDRQNIPQLVDIDCNDRPDLMIGRISGHILHYEVEDRKAAVPVFRLVTPEFQGLEIVTGNGSLHGANTMAFIDFDSDGDLDLFWGDFFEAGLLLFENVGSCTQPQLRREGVRFPLRTPLVTSGYNAPAFGDLMGQGRSDLIVGVLGGAYDPIKTSIDNLHFLEATAGGEYQHRTSHLLPMIDVGNESIPSLVDLDADGDLDLLVANKIEPGVRSTSRIYWFENTGTPTAPQFVLRGALPLEGKYHFAPAFGDLDGDGTLDMLLGSFGASVARYTVTRDPGGPRFTLVDSAFITISRGSNTTPALGDLDGDGLLDLLIGEASGAFNFYRNIGTRTAPVFSLVSDEWLGQRVGRRSSPHLVDIDGDGVLDLLVGTDDEGLRLLRNTGSATAPTFVLDPRFAPAVYPQSSPAAADLDGDGRPELIVGNRSGGLLYFTRRPGSGAR
ncbi:MAG: VCBS repeat-containing protein [Gemmatimonadota bacterium]|nr:VCBS repeat-containing protein [Gemmatimonadota bacterium]